jgi:nicotinate-nucleotide adenylyltransferase
MGGSFDPIHLGHLRAAENAREALSLEKVLFIPAGQPPHKPQGTVSSAVDRFSMVALGTAGHAVFVPDDLEIRRGGPSYTAETLDELAKGRPDAEIFLIVGADTLPEMKSWREPERIFALCTVAVASRPSDGGGGPAHGGEAPNGARVVAVPGPGLPLSATAVRQRVREGRSVRYLVPDPVADYIAKRRLYA